MQKDELKKIRRAISACSPIIGTLVVPAENFHALCDEVERLQWRLGWIRRNHGDQTAETFALDATNEEIDNQMAAEAARGE